MWHPSSHCPSSGPGLSSRRGTWPGPVVGPLLGQIQTWVHLTSEHWPFPLCPSGGHPWPRAWPLPLIPLPPPPPHLVAAGSTATSGPLPRTSPALSVTSVGGNPRPQMRKLKVTYPVQAHTLKRANYDANFHHPDPPSPACLVYLQGPCWSTSSSAQIRKRHPF